MMKKPVTTLSAQNHSTCTASVTGVAIAVQAEGKAPNWVHLLPRGPEIVGRDGRSWVMPDPALVVASTRAALPIPIDYEHASEDEAPNPDGGVPAAAWVEEVELRDDGIWGRTDWTPKGSERVANKEYRFLSPVIRYQRGSKNILSVSSAGLVHYPNLTLTALNRRDDQLEPQSMKTILAALGLALTATEEDALVAINALKDDHQKALNAVATPSLEKFVPRAQHDETVKALNAANDRLASVAKAENEARVAALIDDAVKAGKVAPAAKDNFTALALNNFEATKAAIDGMPAIVTEGEDAALNKATSAPGTSGLTDSQKATCRQLGLSEEEYAKALA